MDVQLYAKIKNCDGVTPFLGLGGLGVKCHSESPISSFPSRLISSCLWPFRWMRATLSGWQGQQNYTSKLIVNPSVSPPVPSCQSCRGHWNKWEKKIKKKCRRWNTELWCGFRRAIITPHNLLKYERHGAFFSNEDEETLALTGALHLIYLKFILDVWPRLWLVLFYVKNKQKHVQSDFLK